MHIYKLDKQTSKQANKQTSKQANKQANKQTSKQKRKINMNTQKTQNQFLNLTQDLMFKLYFSKDKQVLMFLLNTFLPLPPGKSVQAVSFLDVKKQQPYQDKKKHTGQMRTHSKRTRKN